MKARADTLFYGGKIYTMEAPDICKDAVVLKDGKFATWARRGGAGAL